jgi:hypothetical protein
MEHWITQKQWANYERDGYLNLGKLLDTREVEALQRRLDDIMLGRAPVDYDRMVMQLEGEAGEYNKQGEQTRGFKKPTLNYRVIYGLEYDPLFLAYLQRPLFREICSRVYGPETEIATYRAFVMNKPAHGGSDLQWHQDRWTFLEPDPLITIWTALNPSTEANGCLRIIRGSHHAGVINPSAESGSINAEQVEKHCPPEDVVHIELEPGEVVLLHNWLLHSSGTNRTDMPRRGFSVCYMDARTRDIRPVEERSHLYDPSAYPLVFGENALDPSELAAAI